MPRVFEITPKRIKRSNNTVLTPEMKVTITTKILIANVAWEGTNIGLRTQGQSIRLVRSLN